MPERTAQVNRIQQGRATTQVQLVAVAREVLGKSGRALLDALIAGTTGAAVRADLAQGRRRAKWPELQQALAGQGASHHRCLVRQVLAHIDFWAGTLATIPAEIAACVSRCAWYWCLAGAVCERRLLGDYFTPHPGGCQDGQCPFWGCVRRESRLREALPGRITAAPLAGGAPDGGSQGSRRT